MAEQAALAFHAPPGWGPLPDAFLPGAGWRPDPRWPQVPPGWIFYTRNGQPTPAPADLWQPAPDVAPSPATPPVPAGPPRLVPAPHSTWEPRPGTPPRAGGAVDGLTGARDPQDGPSAALPGSAPAPGRRPLNLRVLFAVVSVGVALVLVAGVSLVVRSGATYRGSATQTQNAVERLEIGGGGQIDPKDQFVLDLSTHTFTNDSSSPGNPQPVRADPAKCQQLADAYEGFSSAYDYDDVVEGRSTFFEEDSGAALSRDSPQSASTFRYASRGAAERHFDKDRADLSSCPSFTMTSDSGTVETVTRQVKDTGGLLAHSWEVTTYDSEEKYRAPSVGRYMLIGSSVVAVGWDISPGKTSTPQSRDEFERELRKSLRSRA